MPAGYKFKAFCTDNFIKSNFGKAVFKGGAAGPEVLSCTEDYEYKSNRNNEIRLENEFIESIGVIGDTGGSDISQDADCNCDTRITFIRFRAFNFIVEDDIQKVVKPGSKQ